MKRFSTRSVCPLNSCALRYTTLSNVCVILLCLSHVSHLLLGQPVDDCCTFLYRANIILVMAVFPSMHPKVGTLFLAKFEMLKSQRSVLEVMSANRQRLMIMENALY